jgi:transcriptional antiterminator NusG
MAIPLPHEQWYVVQVRTGTERRVRDNMMHRVTTENMGSHVFDILVPSEQVEEVKNNRKTVQNRKFYPGYVLANIHLLDENNRLIDKTWYFVKETDGVLNFAGTKDHPVPMRLKEVEEILAQIRDREGKAKPKVDYTVGDNVVVKDGAFESQTGIIEKIDHEKGILLVSVNIFGRSTPVELEFWQVERSSE